EVEHISRKGQKKLRPKRHRGRRWFHALLLDIRPRPQGNTAGHDDKAELCLCRKGGVDPAKVLFLVDAIVDGLPFRPLSTSFTRPDDPKVVLNKLLQLKFLGRGEAHTVHLKAILSISPRKRHTCKRDKADRVEEDSVVGTIGQISHDLIDKTHS